jgi:hypothetical protein
MLNILLPSGDLREQVYDYIPVLLAEYQGGLKALFITQVRPGANDPGQVAQEIWDSKCLRVSSGKKGMQIF